MACLLERRETDRWWTKDGFLASVHIFVDASPTVGHEILGIILELVAYSGAIETRILPPVSLAYGAFGLIHKAVALLWSLFLILGPSQAKFDWFRDKVASVTTDMGTEFRLMSMPDISRTFFEYLRHKNMGVAAPLTNRAFVLFPKSIRLPGWSHLWSNIMHMVSKQFGRYPEFVEHLRYVCKTFRNPTWVEHLLRKYPDEASIQWLQTRKWTASLAKWRFETMHFVAKCVLGVRSFLQNTIEASVFTNPQDTKAVEGLFKACQDAGFWRWLQASYTILFVPVEMARRWGLVCKCHEEEMQTKLKPVPCPENRKGRRLREAKKFIDRQRALMKATRRSLRLADVEGDHELLKQMKSAISRVMDEMRVKFQHVSTVPLLLVLSNETPELAQDCLDRLLKLPRERLEPLAVWWLDNMQDELRSVAAGNPASDKHLAEIKRMEDSSFNEAIGESFHRGTAHAQTRAPNATTIHILSRQRMQQSIALGKRWLQRGPLGKRAVNFEWKQHKRVIQASTIKKIAMRRRKLKDSRFYRRFYRLDAADEAEDHTLGRPYNYLL
jgi:hypothetical protein